MLKTMEAYMDFGKNTTGINSAQRHKSLHRRKFTLVELLVVIAIIVILAGLLMPALSKAKESSRRIVCASNIKQIGCAFYEYIGDYDSWCPWFYRSGAGWWPNQLYPYLNKQEIFCCPAHSPKPTSFIANNNTTRDTASYGYNLQMGGVWNESTSYNVRFGNLKKLTTTIVIGDSKSDGNWQTIIAGYSDVSYRHTSGTNFLWLDGHVERKSFSDISNNTAWFNVSK